MSMAGDVLRATIEDEDGWVMVRRAAGRVWLYSGVGAPRLTAEPCDSVEPVRWDTLVEVAVTIPPDDPGEGPIR